MRELNKLAVEGKLNPYVSARYSLKEAPLALSALLERKVTGKVVIEPR
jgi:NADPH2:quinone reductase